MTALSPSERSYILTGLTHPTQPTRLDGRGLLDSRPIHISYGDAPQASGSSRVVLGQTEVIAGIRLEVGEDGEGPKCSVEVDVTPQAFPAYGNQDLSRLSTQLSSLISDHFIPSVPPIPIVPSLKYFIPHLHLTVLSTSGNLPTALVLAARAAFHDLQIPKIKVISTGKAHSSIEEDGELSGIKGAVRSKGRIKGKGKALSGIEWELDLSGSGVRRLESREELPVIIVLNLVPESKVHFLDAALQEESACPDKLLAFFNKKGKLCGMRMEGDSGLEIDRIRPLLREAQKISVGMLSSLEGLIPV